MFLLDTCTLIWLTSDKTHLSPKILEILQDVSSIIHISSFSAFEVGLLVRKGRFKTEKKVEEWFMTTLKKLNLSEIPVNGKIAAFSTQLPRIHDDPADRILVATAILNNLTILTPDSRIQQYPNVKCVW